MYGYIYKTTNNVNGLIYIGQHKGTFTKRYLGSGTGIREAVKKWGRHNFTVEPICWCESAEGADEAEKQLIAEYDATNPSIGYNRTRGGKTFHGDIPWNKGLVGVQVAWNKGIPCSGETKAKISEANSKKVLCHQTGKVYGSTKEAGEVLGLRPTYIQNVARGVTKKVKRLYTFEYVK